jgi:hypothetical protein
MMAGPRDAPVVGAAGDAGRGVGASATIPFEVGHAGLVVVVSPERVRAACVARGWSLSELSRRARVSRPTLRSAMLGRTVRPLTAWKLARALSQGAVESELDDILEMA